jgi:hypothetical protein
MLSRRHQAAVLTTTAAALAALTVHAQEVPPGVSAAPALDRIVPEPPVSAPEASGLDVALGGTREPTIAINPTNPMNVAMADLFQLRVSTDGGVTWSAGTVPPVPPPPAPPNPMHVPAGDPSIAFDSTGRLFWSYLGALVTQPPPPIPPALVGIDIFVVQVNPATGATMGAPVNVTAAVGMPASNQFLHDKQWLAADHFTGSPFQDRLYLVWTQFLCPGPGGGTRVLTTFSANQGAAWNGPPQNLTLGAQGFVWPSHNAVGPNGDLYVAWHAQPDWTGCAPLVANPNGTSGHVMVARSVNGGASFLQKSIAFAPGQADITFNVQHIPGGTIPGTTFWLQGSAQPWVLPDPVKPGNVYVIANDDLDDMHGMGDDADVLIVRSTDNGMTWSAPAIVNLGADGAFQVMPTAAIDKRTGCIAVTWYDNRRGKKNAAGNFLLDVYYAVSRDGGFFFSPPVRMNNAPFDPDVCMPAAQCTRFPGPPATTRIGEYNGVAMLDGTIHANWTGNTAASHQIITDSVPCACGIDLTCIPMGSEGGCCIFEWRVHNRRNVTLGDFYIDIEAGSGAQVCNMIANVTPPGAYTPLYCYPFDFAVPSNWAVLCLTGDTVPPNATAFGMLKIDVNGAAATPVMIPGWVPFTVAANGIHVHVTDAMPAPGQCAAGLFGAHIMGQTQLWGKHSHWIWTDGMPVCPIDNPFSCQLADGEGHGGAGASSTLPEAVRRDPAFGPGIIASASDLNPIAGVVTADDFATDADQMVDTVCWWGAYANVAGGLDCGPGPGDGFLIWYYSDRGDCPGAVHAGPFAVVPTKTATGGVLVTEIGNLQQYEYTARHPAVMFAADECYWIEISNNTTGNQCIWLWQTAPAGNGAGAQTDSTAVAYACPADKRDYDLAWCLGVDNETGAELGDPGGCACPWDLDGDGDLGMGDLLIVLSTWGPNPGAPADFDGDGEVGFFDLLKLLSRWGPCPG